MQTPSMLEKRLSKTACATLLLFMSAMLYGYNLLSRNLTFELPLWTDIAMEAALLLIPGIMLCLLCKSSVPKKRLGVKRTALVIGMGVTGYVFTILLNVTWTVCWTAVFSGTDAAQLNAQSMDQYALFRETPLWLLLLVLAVTPAICEEFYFRGMLMKSMSANPAMAIVISAALFAMMHMSVTKFYATFALGLFIGWVVMRTGALHSGMILHFMNNAFAAITLRAMSGLYEMLETVAPTEEAVYNFIMSRPELATQVTFVVFGAVLLFVLSIPLFFLFLTMFIKDTKEDALAVHEHGLALCESGAEKDVLGTILLIVCAVVLFVMMLHISIVFGG